MSLPDAESKYQVSQEEKVPPSDSIHDVGIKLDPHGYPLRPQPSDDPLGASREFKPARSDYILIRSRPLKLEQVVQAINCATGLFSGVPRAFLASMHSK